MHEQITTATGNNTESEFHAKKKKSQTPSLRRKELNIVAPDPSPEVLDRLVTDPESAVTLLPGSNDGDAHEPAAVVGALEGVLQLETLVDALAATAAGALTDKQRLLGFVQSRERFESSDPFHRSLVVLDVLERLQRSLESRRLARVSTPAMDKDALAALEASAVRFRVLKVEDDGPVVRARGRDC